MRMFGKVLVSAAALAFASSLSLGVVQATPVTGKVAVSSDFDLVAAKKAAKKKVAAKKKKPAAKKAAAKKGGPGTCGAYNYWDKKTKKCASAMTKKS
jgi:hypothetical protein